MKRNLCSTAVIISLAQLSAVMNLQAQSRQSIKEMKADMEIFQQQSTIMRKYGDTEAWREQRQKIALATGDRIFDQDFARVFDSLVVAVSSLELEVKNMERASGYIQASGVTLPPAQAKATMRMALDDWCKQNGIDSTIFDKKFYNPQNRAKADSMCEDTSKKSLTFQLVKMGDQQTKVKLRFSSVIFPPEMEEYCKMIWKAVDKQIFVDKTVEGAVEERKTEVPAQKPSMDSQNDSLPAQIAELRKANAEMKAEIDALKARVNALSSAK